MKLTREQIHALIQKWRDDKFPMDTELENYRPNKKGKINQKLNLKKVFIIVGCLEELMS